RGRTHSTPISRHPRTANMKLIYSASSASPELRCKSNSYTWQSETASCRGGDSDSFLSPLRSRRPARPVEMLDFEGSPQTSFLACWGNSAILGYLWPSCNCLGAFLCPLGAVLGIQPGRFPLRAAHFSFPLLQI